MERVEHGERLGLLQQACCTIKSSPRVEPAGAGVRFQARRVRTWGL